MSKFDRVKTPSLVRAYQITYNRLNVEEIFFEYNGKVYSALRKFSSQFDLKSTVWEVTIGGIPYNAVFIGNYAVPESVK